MWCVLGVLRVWCCTVTILIEKWCAALLHVQELLLVVHSASGICITGDSLFWRPGFWPILHWSKKRISSCPSLFVLLFTLVKKIQIPILLIYFSLGWYISFPRTTTSHFVQFLLHKSTESTHALFDLDLWSLMHYGFKSCSSVITYVLCGKRRWEKYIKRALFCHSQVDPKILVNWNIAHIWKQRCVHDSKCQ